MADLPFNRFSTTSKGISLDDIVGILAVDFDPSTGAGFDAPVGSLALRTNGSMYQKIGIGDTSWTVNDPGAGGGGGSLNITLNVGGTCTVAIVGPTLPITLNGGGICNVAL